MPDVRLRFWRARDGDDVKAYFLSDVVCFHVVVDGQLQTPLLAEVNGFFGVTEDVVAAGLHLYEYNYVTIFSDDIQVSVA